MPPTLEDEVTFISGVNADGTVAATSYQAWDGDVPAGYITDTGAGKWGGGAPGTAGGTINYYFDPASHWTATEKTVYRDALALYSAIANIHFTEVHSAPASGLTFIRGTTQSARTRYDFATGQSSPVGSHTLAAIQTASVTIDTSDEIDGFGPVDGNFATFGGYVWQTIVHEIGHAVAIGHGGPYDAGEAAAVPNQFSAYDTRLSAIMSYIDPRFNTHAPYFGQYPVDGVNWGNSPDGSRRVPVTLMPLDILALQRLYGPSQSTLLDGGDTFGFNSTIDASLPFYDFTINTRPVVTLFDTGTNNTLDLSGFGAAANINLNPGTYSSTNGLTNNLAIAYNTAIETLVLGGGADTVLCNDNGDIILGGGGNDTISVGKGDDTVAGGAGTDMAVFTGSQTDYSIRQTASGTIVSGPDGRDSLSGVEGLQFRDATVAEAASIWQKHVVDDGIAPVLVAGNSLAAPPPQSFSAGLFATPG